MHSNQFKLVFKGNIVSGYHIEDVKVNLSKILKITIQKAEQLFSSPSITIRKIVDKQTALEYKRAFEKAGAILELIEVVNNRFSRPELLIPTKIESSIKTAFVKTQRIFCPACDYEQDESTECIKCGIVFDKYICKSASKPLDNSFSSQPPINHTPSSFRKRPIGNKILVLASITIAILFFASKWFEVEISIFSSEMPAPDAPLQTVTNKTSFNINRFRICPHYAYTIKARVLSKKMYSSGTEASLSPVDLVLGWGPMSDQSVLRTIKITQEDRFYFWWTRELPIPKAQIIQNSANTHIIPADDDVRKFLNKVEKHDVVMMKGYLVSVTQDNGWEWKTSIKRTDTGDGACEIMFVEHMEII